MKNDLILELMKMLLNKDENSVTQIKSDENFGIGSICIIRTCSAGVHFGRLVSRCDKECMLEDAQRVYSWQGACSLSQLAKEGSKDRDNCKISVTVSSILLTEVIEIIPMTNEAYSNLSNGGVIWKK